MEATENNKYLVGVLSNLYWDETNNVAIRQLFILSILARFTPLFPYNHSFSVDPSSQSIGR